MADEIIQNDNGTVMEATISDKTGIVDIRGASVEFTVLSGTRRFVKQGRVADGLLGLCDFTLNSEDVSEVGTYAFQGTVTFPSGKKFSSNIHKFKVGQKI